MAREGAAEREDRAGEDGEHEQRVRRATARNDRENQQNGGRRTLHTSFIVGKTAAPQRTRAAAAATRAASGLPDGTRPIGVASALEDRGNQPDSAAEAELGAHDREPSLHVDAHHQAHERHRGHEGAEDRAAAQNRAGPARASRAARREEEGNPGAAEADAAADAADQRSAAQQHEVGQSATQPDRSDHAAPATAPRGEAVGRQPATRVRDLFPRGPEATEVAGAGVSEGIAERLGVAAAEEAIGAERPDDDAIEGHDSTAAGREATLAKPQRSRIGASRSGGARTRGGAGQSDHGAAERTGHSERRNREDGGIGAEAERRGNAGHREAESAGSRGVHGDVRAALSPLVRFYPRIERFRDEGSVGIVF